MNQQFPINQKLIWWFLMTITPFISLAQDIEKKQFVFENITSAEMVLAADSVIRSLDGLQLLRADYSTKNCIGLFSAEHHYNKQTFTELLSPLGIGVKCFTSNVYNGEPLIPIHPRYCRDFSEITELHPERGAGACCNGGLSNGTGGCENLACEAAICNLDAFCCNYTWDMFCASEAIDNAQSGGACSGVSDCPSPGVGTGLCCSANGTPGCQNAACQTAICALDAFCCTNLWDAMCADAAITNANAGLACAGVSNCGGGIGGGPCCAAAGNGSTGCNNSGCQTAICAQDAFCCTIIWDGLCAEAALADALDGGPCSGISDCPTGNTGGPVTASDCANAINVCTDINFSVDPNGFGNTNEIPSLGSFSNPAYGLFGEPSMPWGSGNQGCLRSNELNSTWMIVNVEAAGILEFTFGGLGTQTGFYDWIMYPYNSNTCTNIINDNIAPVRCNWNLMSSGGTGLANIIPPGGNAGNFEPPLNVNMGDQFVICFSNWSSITTSVPLQFGGSAGVSCTPLPVELKSFSAKTAGLDVQLNWTTATEINNDHFTIQRSTDGSHWKEIASISGNGFSTQEIHYEHVDKNPPSGYLYYRLFQQDFNGSPEIIGNAAVDMGLHNISVYPNPSKGDWCISGIEFHENLLIELNDIRGRTVPIETAFQNQQLLLKMMDHKPGMYFLKLTDKSGRLVELLRLVAIE